MFGYVWSSFWCTASCSAKLAKVWSSGCLMKQLNSACTCQSAPFVSTAKWAGAKPWRLTDPEVDSLLYMISTSRRTIKSAWWFTPGIVMVAYFSEISHPRILFLCKICKIHPFHHQVSCEIHDHRLYLLWYIYICIYIIISHDFKLLITWGVHIFFVSRHLFYSDVYLSRMMSSLWWCETSPTSRLVGRGGTWHHGEVRRLRKILWWDMSFCWGGPAKFVFFFVWLENWNISDGELGNLYMRCISSIDMNIIVNTLITLH